MSKRIIFLLIGILVSVVSLYLAFRDFDFGKVWESLLRIRVEYLLLGIVPYILTFMTKVWRWRVMFHPDEGRTSVGLLFSALMISYIPLPFRAGEVARGVVVGARSGLQLPRVFSTIVVEKVLDVLTLLLLLGFSLPFVSLPPALQGPAILVGIAVLAFALVLMSLVLRPDWGRAISSAVASRLPAGLRPRIASATEGVLQGLAPLSNGPIALKLGLWSLATWGINMVTVYFMLLAFNLPLTPFAAVVMVVVTNLSMAVPAAPGSLGTFELAVVTVLTLLGIGEEQAQSFALFYHFIGLAPVALLGVLAAIQLGVGMTAFRAEPPLEQPDDANPPATPGTPTVVPVAAPPRKTAREKQ